MASAKSRERLALERRLGVLGTLGNNAPFIGLFGTVLGIIKAFADLARNAGGGANVVMSGISEALVATAVGLHGGHPGGHRLQRFAGARAPLDGAHRHHGPSDPVGDAPGGGRRPLERKVALTWPAERAHSTTTTAADDHRTSTSRPWSTSCWCCSSSSW